MLTSVRTGATVSTKIHIKIRIIQTSGGYPVVTGRGDVGGAVVVAGPLVVSVVVVPVAPVVALAGVPVSVIQVLRRPPVCWPLSTVLPLVADSLAVEALQLAVVVPAARGDVITPSTQVAPPGAGDCTSGGRVGSPQSPAGDDRPLVGGTRPLVGGTRPVPWLR